MNRLQTIAVATGVVTLLSAGTALAVGAGQGGDSGAAARNGGTGAEQAAVVAFDDQSTPTSKPSPSVTPGSSSTPESKRSQAAAISAERAEQLALAKVGGGYADEIEREWEHGRLEWKVEVIKGGQEFDVRVDAQTGAITRFRADDDRSDDRGDDRSDDRGRDDRGDDHGDDRDDNSGRGGDDHGDDRHDDRGGDDD